MKLIRTLLFLVHIVIVLLLAATMLNAYISPKSFPYFNFLSLGFPILMISNVLLIVFWVVSFKKRAVFFIIATAFFLTPIRRWVNYSPQKDKNNAFKVISFNIKGGTLGKEEIENWVNSENPDVVFIQEIGYVENRPYFKNLTGADNPQVVNIFTRHKVINRGSLDFTNNAEGVFNDIQINGKIIRFLNVYLEPFQLHKDMVRPSSSIDRNEEKAKSLVRRFIPVFKLHAEEVMTMKELIKQSPYPVVVGGDFNSVPNSYEYFTINSVLNDAFLEGGSGSGTSFHDYKFPIRIDYLFSSKEIFCQKYSVDRTYRMSDHYPILAEFSFKK